MNKTRNVIAILLLTAVVLSGLSRSSASTVVSEPDLSELAWLAGNWTGVQDGVEMEELWQAPKGNSMLGVHRDVAQARMVSFEFLRIEATAEGITYWSSPGGQPPTGFRLKELKGKRAVFENPKHDFPQRIIYWRSDDGSLHAKIEGTENGKNAAMEWTWQRTPVN